MKQDWEIKRLDEVCDQITDGSHFSPKSNGVGDYPYITVRDINEDIIDFDNCKFIDKDNYQSLLKNGCKPNRGDLLFSKDGTVGKVSLVNFEKEFVVLSSLAIIRPNKKIILPSLLAYILKNPIFLREAIGMKTGVAIRRIILKNLKLIEIQYPKSLPEQQRIVTILDAAFGAIAKAKANAEQNLKNAKELFESYLQGVFEKRGEEWEEKTLGELCNLVDSLHQTPKYSEEGYPMVRVTDIKPGFINLSKTKKVDKKTYDEFSKKHKSAIGDIVFSRVGSYGVSSIVDTKEPFCLGQNTVFIVPKILPHYLYYFLNSATFKLQIDKKVAGTTQPTVSLKSIREVFIPVPNDEEQQTIVRQLDALRAETQKLEAVYKKKIDDLDELKKSLLQKAFSGELTATKELVA